jgi:hypothetical protein
LSPPWTEEDEKSVRRSVLLARRESRSTSVTSTTPPPTANSNEFTDFGIYTGPTSTKSTYTPPSTAGADSSALVGTNFILSFEIEKCLATYICPGAPHQLNLSDLDHACLLQALKQSNHPAVFRLVVQQVENDLRASHREFIHFILSTPELPVVRSHLLASRLIGATLIILSLAAVVIMTGSKINRGFIAVLVPFFFAGVVSSFVAERELFVWCGQEVEEAGEKWKRKLQGVVMMQGIWAGVIATGCFCALFYAVPKGNKF